MKGVREDILIRFGVFLCTSSGKMEPVVIFDNEKKAEGWAKSQLKASRPPPPNYISAIVVKVDFARLRSFEKSILNIKIIQSSAIMKRGNVCPVCRMTQDRWPY